MPGLARTAIERTDHPRDLEPRLEPSERAPLLGVRSQALRQAVERLPSRVRGDTDREGDEEDRGVLVLNRRDERNGAGHAERQSEQHLFVDMVASERRDVGAEEPAGAASGDHEPEEPRGLSAHLEVERDEERQEAHAGAHRTGRVRRERHGTAAELDVVDDRVAPGDVHLGNAHREGHRGQVDDRRPDQDGLGRRQRQRDGTGATCKPADERGCSRQPGVLRDEPLIVADQPRHERALRDRCGLAQHEHGEREREEREARELHGDEGHRDRATEVRGRDECPLAAGEAVDHRADERPDDRKGRQRQEQVQQDRWPRRVG